MEGQRDGGGDMQGMEERGSFSIHQLKEADACIIV